MAMPPRPSGVETAIDTQNADLEDAQTFMPPIGVQGPTQVYKLDPATKVPVSKFEGNVWEGRKKGGLKRLTSLISGWDEAEYYYDNAQDNHRKETAGDQSGTRNYGKDRRDAFSMTQNVVYATVNAVVPNIYAKNPNVEVTMVDPQQERVGVMMEHLLNRLADQQYTPGLNLKPKVRKSIVRCEITNEAWVMIGWTKKEDSADGAREDIRRIGTELTEAKDQNEILRLEGELLALEESIDLLDPAGPWVKTVQAKQVVIDDASVEDDFSDANWKMVNVLLPTNYLNARYRQKNKDGQYTSAYEASHVVDATTSMTDANAMQQELDNFKLFDNSKDNPKDYGYDDRRAYERGKRTSCWYCFDKVKRRFYLYSEKDWTWPIWVFEDPYMLPNFYPLRRLQYHSSPKSNRTRGEVSHYLDQQDEINTILDELNRARVSLRDNTLFNSNVLTVKDVEDILLNANKKMKGIKVPEGQKLEDLIMGPPMPSLQHKHLWDTSTAMQGVTMVSGVMEAMQGEQFKTNTTNDAIASYNSISGVRLDEKRDAVEDFIGGIMADVLFMWLQFGDPETTLDLVGSQYANEVQAIQQLRDPKQIRRKVQCTIEGGSTQKPTSAAKKSEALAVGQILGQFASSSPTVVLLLLKIFERAFDSVVVTETDWKELRQGIMMQLQQGNGGTSPQGHGTEEQGETDQVTESEQGPDEDKALIADLVKKGVPEEIARQKVSQARKGNTQ